MKNPESFFIMSTKSLNFPPISSSVDYFIFETTIKVGRYRVCLSDITFVGSISNIQVKKPVSKKILKKIEIQKMKNSEHFCHI